MNAVLGAADASVIVSIVVGVFGWITARNHKAIRQINKAVNHQPADQPTLIQRVIRLEANQSIHTAWTAKALESVAEQIGAPLPARPPSIVDYEEPKS